MKKKFIVHYSFYLSDSVEIEADNEDEAKKACDSMIVAGEIGDVNRMSLGDWNIWVD